MDQLQTVPRRLQPGNRIAVVAPAGPIDKEGLEIGKRVIRRAGWNPVEGLHLLSQTGYLAGADEERAADLNQAMADPALRAVFCARGGYGSLRILPLLDLDLIQNDPKPLIGFSDNTALSMYLLQKNGLVTFSGPMAAGHQIANLSDEQLRHLTSMLSDPDYRGVIRGNGRCLAPGVCRGPLIGGNLTMLVHCLAADLLPSLEKAILLIEDVNEAPYRIDRALTTLRLAGALDRIGGVLAGSFLGLDDETTDRILLDCLGTLGVPILAGFPVGHGQTNIYLPIGIEMTLDAGQGVLKMEEGAVC